MGAVFTLAMAWELTFEDVRRVYARLGEEILRRRPVEGLGPSVLEVPWLLQLSQRAVEELAGLSPRARRPGPLERGDRGELQQALQLLLYEAVGLGYGLAAARSRRGQGVPSLTRDVLAEISAREVGVTRGALRARVEDRLALREAGPDWLTRLVQLALAHLAPSLQVLAAPCLWRPPDTALLLALRRLRNELGGVLFADLALGYGLAAEVLGEEQVA